MYEQKDTYDQPTNDDPYKLIQASLLLETTAVYIWLSLLIFTLKPAISTSLSCVFEEDQL